MRFKYDIHKCFKCSQARLKNDLPSWKNFPVAKLAMSPVRSGSIVCKQQGC